MESNDKHILDKQLHDKLYDQEVAPPDFAWDNIDAELDGKTNPKHPFIFKGLMIATAIALSVGILSTLLYLNDTHGTKSMNNAVSTSTESLNTPSKVQTDGSETGFSNSETNAATSENSAPIQSQAGNGTTNDNSAKTPIVSNQDNHLSSTNANQNNGIENSLPSVAKASSLPNKKEVSGLQKTPPFEKEQVEMNAPLPSKEKPANLIPSGIKSNTGIFKTNKGKALKQNTASTNAPQTGFEKDNTMNDLSKLHVNHSEKTTQQEVQSKKVSLDKINNTKTQSQNNNQSQGFKNKTNTKGISTNMGTTEKGLVKIENTPLDGVDNKNKVTSKKASSTKLASNGRPNNGKEAAYNPLKTGNLNAAETGFGGKENNVNEGPATNQQGNAIKLYSPKITKEQTPVKALETNLIDSNPKVTGMVKKAEETKSEVQNSNTVPVSTEQTQTLGNSKNDSTVANAPKTVLLDSSKTKPADAVTVKSRDSSAVKKNKLKISPNGVVFQMLYNQPNYANLNGTSTASNLTSTLSLNSKSFLASLLYNTSIHPLIDINVGLSYQYNTVTVAQNLTTVKKYSDTTHRFFDSLVVVGVDTFGNPKYANQQFNKLIITERSEESNTNNSFQNQYAYLGVPIEVIFKKDVFKKLQFMALVGFRMQFLVYENLAEANAESKVTVASKSFNYYGSIGLGYKLTDKFTLTAALNMANVSDGQVTIYNNNSTSKVVFSPELRCSWFIF